MTELEKIEYAKSFIDKLANGINPLDETPIPEGDVANHVRLSRCFFYVSSLLQKEIEREKRKKRKVTPLPFSITQEQLQAFEYTSIPISASAIARKINFIVKEAIEKKEMKRFSYRNINYWLYSIGMIEWRDWENGMRKRFPSAEGEAMGLELQIWESYNKRTPVIYFTEAAQRFITDNIDAVIAAEPSSPQQGDEESEG